MYWIILFGDKYDITDFMKRHPGGQEILLEYCEQDATQVFKDVGHTKKYLKKLKKN